MKNQTRMKPQNLWLVHILGWILFMALPLTIVSREPSLALYVSLYTSFSFWVFLLFYGVIFYANTQFLIPSLFIKKAYIVYSGIFFVGLALVLYLQPFENLIFQRVNPNSGPPEISRRDDIPPPGLKPFDSHRPPAAPPRREQRRERQTIDFVSIVLYLVVWVVGMAIKISEEWRRSERKIILTEAAKAQTELSFLKAQINPHFLFNTLNNIYSLALVHSENTAPSIMKLSKMMRYITEEAIVDFVPLADEISYLESFIDLQKLRLNARTKVDFKYTGVHADNLIAPLMMMTFVENAFKYGISNHHESTVEIAIQVQSTGVTFHCKNRIFESRREGERKGIGIVNTRKRLDMLYPEKHRLEITDDGSFFTVDLELRMGGVAQ